MLKTILICGIMGCSQQDTVPQKNTELFRFRSDEIHATMLIKERVLKDSIAVNSLKIDSLKKVRDSLLIEINKLK